MENIYHEAIFQESSNIALNIDVDSQDMKTFYII